MADVEHKGLNEDDMKFLEILETAPDVTLAVAAAYVDGMKAGALLRKSATDGNEAQQDKTA